MTEAEQFWDDFAPASADEVEMPPFAVGAPSSAEEMIEQQGSDLTHQAWDGLTEVL